MKKTSHEALLTVLFSSALVYVLFVQPYALLLQRGWYQGTVVLSGSYTDWQIVESNTRIWVNKMGGTKVYTVHDVYHGPDLIALDYPDLVPGEETETTDQNGDFWYVYLPREQGSVPSRLFTRAAFGVIAYLLVLLVIYRIRWRPELTRERQEKEEADAAFAARVRELHHGRYRDDPE